MACAITRYAPASHFVTALGAHDVGAMQSFGARKSFPLRDTLDRFGRITIRGWSADEDGGAIRIHIDGTGIAVNARHDVTPIPATWILRDGIATTEDHVIAQTIIAAQDDAARDAIVAAHPEYTPHDLLLAVLDELEETGDPNFALRDAMAWVITTAENRRDWGVESRAIAEREPGESGSQATRNAEAALAIARRTDDCDVVGSALLRTGNGRNLATSGSGDQVLWQAASMADALDDGRIALKALHNYTASTVWNGDLRHGFAAAELLAKKSRQFGWREGETMAHLSMADIDEIVGDNEAALALRRQALSGLDAVGNRDFVTWVLASMGVTEVHLGRRNAGLRDLNAALARAGAAFQNRELLVDTVAEMDIEGGRVRDAERLLRRQPDTHSIVRAKLFAAKHRYVDMLAAARTAIVGWPEDESAWEEQMLAGHALLHLGRREEAIASLQAAIDTIERRRAKMDATALRRERFFEARLEPYRDLLDIQLRAGRPREALKIAETIKARSLLDTLSLGRAEVRAALSPAEEERRRTLETRVEQLNRKVLAGGAAAQLGEARKALESFDEEMALRHAVARGVRSSELSENLDAVVRSQDVAAIEYAVLPRFVIAFAIVRDAHGNVAIHATRIGITAAEVERRTAALHRTIAARSLASDAQLAKLYDLLLAPFRPWIAGRKLLLIVPDGALWQVPFQALAPRGGEPLVVQTAVAYAPSFAALTVSRTHGGESRRPLLAMGDASVGSAAKAELRSFNHNLPLGRLPDAADEVRAIAAEYGANNSDVFVHEAATETALKASAGRHRIIHIATHGIADSRWPMFSALVLAPTAQDDGLLEAREVADMHLDADLVVLSACDTARGLIRSGEGVVGMSWAFLLAGCPRTVVSQWSADSKATSLLMIEFHRQLLRGATPAEALRRAELTLMRGSRYTHPYYWANFIVLGNP